MSNPKKLPGGNVIDLVRVWETYSAEEASINKCVARDKSMQGLPRDQLVSGPG